MATEELIQKIRNMTEEEYDAFRLEKWNEKRKQWINIPKWWMADKHEYIIFLTTMKEKGKEVEIDIDKIAAMSNEEWLEFREQRRMEKEKLYSGPMQKWFMDRNQYINFLSNYSKKKSKK